MVVSKLPPFNAPRLNHFCIRPDLYNGISISRSKCLLHLHARAWRASTLSAWTSMRVNCSLKRDVSGYSSSPFRY
jgi:hypothetical protein